MVTFDQSLVSGVENESCDYFEDLSTKLAKTNSCNALNLTRQTPKNKIYQNNFQLDFAELTLSKPRFLGLNSPKYHKTSFSLQANNQINLLNVALSYNHPAQKELFYKILLREKSPFSGKIFIDRMNLTQISKDQIYQKISIISKQRRILESKLRDDRVELIIVDDEMKSNSNLNFRRSEELKLVMNLLEQDPKNPTIVIYVTNYGELTRHFRNRVLIDGSGRVVLLKN